ncbi:heavy metal-binding protein HIP-like [Ostrea edulis]|uniref:heavy metal-binding protein HIP-like n=1 Tax=Ostrea edulis TaxID=37623 RepID=UPI0024AEC641|nr:heavy metal-binding protein HIP-like [Ostrea edulis]
MAKCWIFAMLILIFVVQCIVANDLEMEAWRKNMESRLLKLERENVQLKMKNEEQDKTIKLLIEENNQLKEVFNKARINAEPPILVPGNDSRTLLNTSGARGEVLELSTDKNIHKSKRNGRERQERLLQSNTPHEGVAFYAYISSIHTPALEAKHIIIYDVVVTNRGNGYHRDNGIFIVPQTGVYVFTWTVVVQEAEWIDLEIVLNGSPFGSIVADTVNTASGDWDCSTGVTVKEVNAGDHVYIRTIDHRAVTIIYSGTNARTSFAGWQLL